MRVNVDQNMLCIYKCLSFLKMNNEDSTLLHMHSLKIYNKYCVTTMFQVLCKALGKNYGTGRCGSS